LLFLSILYIFIFIFEYFFKLHNHKIIGSQERWKLINLKENYMIFINNVELHLHEFFTLT